MSERALVLEFAGADEVVAAARHLQGAGCRQWEVFGPYPLPELQGLQSVSLNGLNATGWGGALLGILLAVGLQWGAAYGYPVNIGGRPPLAVPMWPVLALLLAILFAAFGLVLGFLLQCRLPRLHHPLFDVAQFAAASDEGFFLCVALDDAAFTDELGAQLRAQAVRADEVSA